MKFPLKIRLFHPADACHLRVCHAKRATFTQQKKSWATDLVPKLRQERHIYRNKTKTIFKPQRGDISLQLFIGHVGKMSLLTELENLFPGWILQRCCPYGAGPTKSVRGLNSLPSESVPMCQSNLSFELAAKKNYRVPFEDRCVPISCHAKFLCLSLSVLFTIKDLQFPFATGYQVFLEEDFQKRDFLA
jgi:hypothetical protein